MPERHQCRSCNAAFESSEALESHYTTYHGYTATEGEGDQSR